MDTIPIGYFEVTGNSITEADVKAKATLVLKPEKKRKGNIR